MIRLKVLNTTITVTWPQD